MPIALPLHRAAWIVERLAHREQVQVASVGVLTAARARNLLSDSACGEFQGFSSSLL